VGAGDTLSISEERLGSLLPGATAGSARRRFLARSEGTTMAEMLNNNELRRALRLVAADLTQLADDDEAVVRARLRDLVDTIHAIAGGRFPRAAMAALHEQVLRRRRPPPS
jgi:hypothetical protein